MGDVIPFNRAERRRRQRDAERFLRSCPPRWQEVTQELIQAAVADSSERLLRDVLQVLHIEFCWTQGQLGSLVAALNAHSRAQPRPGGQAAAGEVKQSDEQRSKEEKLGEPGGSDTATNQAAGGDNANAPEPA